MNQDENQRDLGKTDQDTREEKDKATHSGQGEESESSETEEEM